MKTSSKIALGAAVVDAVVLAKKKSAENVSGVGAVLWEYAIMECEKRGINLKKNYFEQSGSVLTELRDMRKKFGYRQSASSKAMGRSENQSFYYALQRHAGQLEG